MNVPPIRLDERTWGRLASFADLRKTTVQAVLTEAIGHVINPPATKPAPKRVKAKPGECVNGHDMTNPANVRILPNGQNRCAECARIRTREHYERTLKKPERDMSLCKHGHDLTYLPNQRVRPSGRVDCLVCERARSAASYAKKKAAQKGKEG